MSGRTGKVALETIYFATGIMDVLMVPTIILLGVPSDFPASHKHHMPPSTAEIVYGCMYDLVMLSVLRFLLTLWFLVYFERRKIADFAIVGSSFTTVYVSIRTLVLQSTVLDTLTVHQVAVGLTLFFAWCQLGVYLVGIRWYGELYWQTFDLFDTRGSRELETEPLLRHFQESVPEQVQSSDEGEISVSDDHSKAACSPALDGLASGRVGASSPQRHTEPKPPHTLDSRVRAQRKSPTVLAFTTFPTIFHPDEEKRIHQQEICNGYVETNARMSMTAAPNNTCIASDEFYKSPDATLKSLSKLLPSEILSIFEPHLFNFLENPDVKYVEFLLEVLKEGENSQCRIKVASDSPMAITENLHICEMLIYRTVLIWYYDWEFKTAFKLRKALKMLEVYAQRGARVIGDGTSHAYYLQVIFSYGLLYWFLPCAPKSTKTIILNTQPPQPFAGFIRVADDPLFCLPFLMLVARHPAHPHAAMAMYLLLLRYDWIPQQTLLFSRHDWESSIDWLVKLYWSTPRFRSIRCLLHMALKARPWTINGNYNNLLAVPCERNALFMSLYLANYSSIMRSDFAGAASVLEHISKTGNGAQVFYGYVAYSRLVFLRLATGSVDGCSTPEDIQQWRLCLTSIPHDSLPGGTSNVNDAAAIELRGTSFLQYIAMNTKKEPLAQFGFDRLYDVCHNWEGKLGLLQYLELNYMGGMWLRLSVTAESDSDNIVIDRKHNEFISQLQGSLDAEKDANSPLQLLAYLLIVNLLLIKYSRLHRQGIIDSSLLDEASQLVIESYEFLPLMKRMQSKSCFYVVAHLIAHHGWIEKLKNNNISTPITLALFELLNLLPNAPPVANNKLIKTLHTLIPIPESLDTAWLESILSLQVTRVELVPLFIL